jgi:signal transduction histidine kinase
VSRPEAEPVGEVPFLQRMLQALVAETNWTELGLLVVESWIRLGGATAALLISPENARELQVIASRSGSEGSPRDRITSVRQSFGALLDRATIAETLGESGMIGGLHVEYFIWPELATALVVQFPVERSLRSPESTGLGGVLVPLCQQLLSRSIDRPVRIPDASLLESMAEYAAGAGHEINNPLGSILGQAQMLLKGDYSAECRQACETIGAQAWRIRDMIGNSMLFARPPRPVKKDMNLNATAQDVIRTLSPFATSSGISLNLDCPSSELTISADRSQIRILLSQLIRNSVDALRGVDRTGMVTVRLGDDLLCAAEISVIDDGPGINSPETDRHLFNPFYSGRSAGRGLGFGLCLVWQIVRGHGGLILHETPSGGGAAFHLAFPRSGPE